MLHIGGSRLRVISGSARGLYGAEESEPLGREARKDEINQSNQPYPSSKIHNNLYGEVFKYIFKLISKR